MTPNIYQCTVKYWSDNGISVIPTYYKSKRPHSQALINSGYQKENGQATWTPLKHCLPTEQQISKWFESNQKYNLALITNDTFVVLDFDSPQDYAYWFCWQSEHNPIVLNTYIVSTNRGLHLYYRLTQPLSKPIKSLEPYEVKSHGRLITIPPSVHPNGTPYRAINSPNKILTVDSINDVLTFSPVDIKKPIVKRSAGPWQVKEARPNGRVDLLAMFPEARQTDTEGRYWIADCPFHGHKENFMLDVVDNATYCHAGCGSFLATKLMEILK